MHHTSITVAENNEFTHNHCDKRFIPNYCVGGGGIAAFHSNLTFIGNTTFLRNRSTFGSAGIYMINCSLSSTGSIHFINNSLTAPDFNTHSGVAIWASASSLNISGTTDFVRNRNVGTNNSVEFCCCDVIYASHNTLLSSSETH